MASEPFTCVTVNSSLALITCEKPVFPPTSLFYDGFVAPMTCRADTGLKGVQHPLVGLCMKRGTVSREGKVEKEQDWTSPRV